jgi:hypothetical protein
MAKSKKKSSPTELVTVTDSRGGVHQFRPLEIFCVGAKNFVLLQPVKGGKDQAMILKFSLGPDGLPKAFAAPNEKEFMSAVKALGCTCTCGCGDDDCNCPPKVATKGRPAKAAKKRAAPRKQAKAKSTAGR